MSQDNFGQDLFVGDSWLVRWHIESQSSDVDIEEKHDEQKDNDQVEIDDTGSDAEIDFEEGDNILM